MSMKIVGLLVVVGTTVAHADEVKERADRFAKTVASAKEACGAAITASYDVRPELAAKRSRAPGTGYEYCESVITAIQSTCSEADAKPLLVAKLKSVTCRFEDGIAKKVNEQSSKAGWTHDFDLKLDQGVLAVTFDFSSGNIDSDTSYFLRKTLGINDARSVKRHQKSFADEVDKLHDACGAKIEATYELASELPIKPGDNRDYGNGYTFCVNVLEGIERQCSDKQMKPIVAEKLKRVQCKMEHGSSEKMKAKSDKTGVIQFTDISMANGTLAVLFDWNTANTSDEVWGFLRTTLAPAPADAPSPKRRKRR